MDNQSTNLSLISQDKVQKSQKKNQYEQICNIFTFIRSVSNYQALEVGSNAQQPSLPTQQEHKDAAAEEQNKLAQKAISEQKKYLNKLSAKRSRERKKQLIENQKNEIEELQ